MGAFTKALIAIVFWGASFVATKLLLREVGFAAVVFLRQVLAVPLLYWILRRRGETLHLSGRDRWNTVGLGAIITAHLLIQVAGLTKTTATNTGYLIATIPIGIAILSRLFLKEIIGWRGIAGITASGLGVLLLVSNGKLSSLDFSALTGDLLVLTGSITWPIYTVLGKDVLRRNGAPVITLGVFAVTALISLPFYLATATQSDWLPSSVAGWGSLIFLGIGASALGYLYWFDALKRLSANRLGMTLFLEPIVTMFVAYFVLGERIGAVSLLGGVIILGGVTLVVKKELRIRDYDGVN